MNSRVRKIDASRSTGISPAAFDFLSLRERSVEEKEYPYLYLDATYLKVRWGARFTSMALLACVGVDEEGFREVLAVEVAGSEKAWPMLRYCGASSTGASSFRPSRKP